MIVEDETAVRKSLLHSVDWAKYDMVVEEDVGNGRLAMDSYRRKRFDVVITDIRMPVMDGMELITAIRERDKETVIVILTCLEEFGLLKKAMALGVSDYLVKLTMTDEEMDGVLSKIKYELDSRRRTATGVSAFLDIGSLRNRVLKDFLVHKAYSQEEFIRLERELQLGYGTEAAAVCVLAVGKASPEGNASIDSWQPLKDDLAEAVKPLGEADMFEDDGKWVLAVKLADTGLQDRWTDAIGPFWETLRTRWHTQYGIAVSVGCSLPGAGAAALKGLYAQAVQSLSRSFLGGPGVYCFGDVPGPVAVGPRMAEKIGGLIDEQGVPDEEFVSEYRTRVAAILSSPGRSKEDILNDFQQLIYWMSRMLDRTGGDLSDLVLACSKCIQGADSMNALAGCLSRFFADIRQRIKESRSFSDVILEALQYMESHLDEDLTLKMIAERVHLSPGYFSQLFKKETGINFIDYLQLKRVEKAKEFLVGTHLKLYEIAEKVGFRENTYFSSVFKKSVGISPGEYRKLWLKEAKYPGQGEVHPVET